MNAQGSVPPQVVLERLLAESGRGYVVFVDGLGRMITQLAKSDQDWALRKTLQTETRLLVIGSSRTRPTEALGYEQAFYDFFTERRVH